MSATIEDFEEMAIKCTRCAGDAEVLIIINKQFVCLECAATGKKGKCHE